ncbi:MAG: DUF3999 family protein [Burkholderiaceae bacterium]|nr:DUF3999 family protein [Burkholderiaceae bacterium]
MRVVCAKFAAIVMLATAPAVGAQTLRSEDFALRLPLTTEREGLHALEIPEAAYRAAQTRSLTDMRILNARGEALPIGFLPALPVQPRNAAAVDLRWVPLPAAIDARNSLLRMYALRVERDGDRAVVELGPSGPTGAATAPGGSADTTPSPAGVGGYLIDARGLKDTRGRLVLVFAQDAADYAGRVEVQGSEDLVNWRHLAAGPLTWNRKLGDVIERNTFALDRPPSFIRVGWISKDVPMIAGAQFVEQLTTPVTLPRATLTASLSDDRRTLYVDTPEALPIELVSMRMPEMNRIVRAQVYRHDANTGRHVRRSPLGARRTPEVWHPVGSIEAFRVLRDGAEVEGAPLAMNARTDRLRFDLAAPLEGAVPAIEAQWRPARIVFAALAPGPYQLVVGQRDLATGPSLDARAVLASDDVAGARLPVAAVGTQAEGVRVQTQKLNSGDDRLRARYLLWAVLALAVIGLAWMAWRLLLQLRRQPVSGDGEQMSEQQK